MVKRDTAGNSKRDSFKFHVVVAPDWDQVIAWYFFQMNMKALANC